MRSFTIAQARIEALETLTEVEEAICRVEAFHSTTAEFYRHHARTFDMFSPPDFSAVKPNYTRETVHLSLFKDKLSRLQDFFSKFNYKVKTKYINRDQFDCMRYMFRFETGYPEAREVDEIYRNFPSKELINLQEVINDVMIHFMEESSSDPRFFGLKCFNLRNMMIFFYSRPMVRAETTVTQYVSGQVDIKLGYALMDPNKVLILKCDPIKETPSIIRQR